MCQPAEASHLPSLASPVPSQEEEEQSGGVEEEQAWARQHGLPLTKAVTGSPNCQPQG